MNINSANNFVHAANNHDRKRLLRASKEEEEEALLTTTSKMNKKKKMKKMKISQNLLGFGCNFPVMIQLIEFCSKFINYRHYTIILPFLPLPHVVSL